MFKGQENSLVNVSSSTNASNTNAKNSNSSIRSDTFTYNNNNYPTIHNNTTTNKTNITDTYFNPNIDINVNATLTTTIDQIALPSTFTDKDTVLANIRAAYKAGLEYFKQGRFYVAESELAKALKPVLSKPSMQSVYLNIDNCSVELLSLFLDAMYHIGKKYLASGSYSNNYAKAAAIFQYCVKFSQKYNVQLYNNNTVEASIKAEVIETPNLSISTVDFLAEAYEVEQKFLASIGRYNSNDTNTINGDTNNSFTAANEGNTVQPVQQEIEGYKSDLENLRQFVKDRLAEISDLTVEHISERAKKVQDIYQYCTSFFVNNEINKHESTCPGLVQKMLQSCISQLGNLPAGCDYAVIGLGSLASGKMTPWSDLEFGILINEDKPEYKDYFRKLTQLLQIKVINLGETPLRSVAVEALNNFRTANKADDWFWDHVTPNGFSFDGPDWHACKLPFGRQGNYKAIKKVESDNGVEEEIIVDKPDFELIVTPKKLAEFQAEQEARENVEDNFLVTIKL